MTNSTENSSIARVLLVVDPDGYIVDTPRRLPAPKHSRYTEGVLHGGELVEERRHLEMESSVGIKKRSL